MVSYIFYHRTRTKKLCCTLRTILLIAMYVIVNFGHICIFFTILQRSLFSIQSDEEPIRWLSTCQKICERVILLDCIYMRKRASMPYGCKIRLRSIVADDFCWKTSHKFINVKQIIRLLYIYVITICELCVQLKE